MTQPLWHLLQISDVLDLELASALAERVPLLAWEPRRSLAPAMIVPGKEDERLVEVAPAAGSALGAAHAVRVRQMPLLRGFARAPMSWLARTGPSVLARLLAQTPDPERSPLICTTPFFASVAERWPGPVVYWLTDLIAEYSSARRREVHRLDQRMCRAATLVCPNSRRLESYLIETAGCDAAKIQIVPNATRASNLLAQAPPVPEALPHGLQSIRRPIAGVIGNLAGNMDWLLLQRMVEHTPWLTWMFVGPVGMHVADSAARNARTAVMRMANTDFVGRQPYGALAGYARAFDVAVLPYRRCEPTFSGSSTRFYEHLAACRPILATRGLDELSSKTPLLELFDTPEEGVEALDRLRAKNFDDDLTSLRWHASREATWQTRATAIEQALATRLGDRMTRQAAASGSPSRKHSPVAAELASRKTNPGQDAMGANLA